MIRILFVCHGNICRSPMAEFVMRKLAADAGFSERIETASAATSTEEIGNPVYPPVRKLLAEHDIDCKGKTARQLTKCDYAEYDYIIGMDSTNIRNMRRIFGIGANGVYANAAGADSCSDIGDAGDAQNKLHLLMDFTDSPGDVADPWYTRDFERTWRDVNESCAGFLKNFLKMSELF